MSTFPDPESVDDAVAQWMSRIAAKFSVEEVVGGDLLPHMELERSFGREAMARFRGHFVVSNALQALVRRTVLLTEQSRRLVSNTRGLEHLPFFLGDVASTFRALRASELLFVNGYPMRGLTMLRDVRVEALHFGGLGRSTVDYETLRGHIDAMGNRVSSVEAMGRNRTLAERRFKETFVHKCSFLSDKERRTLKDWERLFHIETHGAQVASTYLVSDYVQTFDPSYLLLEAHPKLQELYVCRHREVSHLLVRALPLLQPEPNVFGVAWVDQWSCLDDALAQATGYAATHGEATEYRATSALALKLAKEFLPFDPGCDSFENVHCQPAGRYDWLPAK